MKNKLLFVVMLILLASFVSAQCPPDCPPDQQQGYSYDQFQQEYASDPALAAQNYPDYYMRHIGDNPDEVANNPQAYENAVRQDVKYINQNRDAFLSYAKTKGVTFASIEGDFKSFDTGTGRIETKSLPGQEPTSFSFSDIKIFESNGGTNFKVNKEGELVYDQPDRGAIRPVTIRGIVEEKSGEVFLSKGKYSVGDEGINIELVGNNRGKLVKGCQNFGDNNCGFIEVEAVSSPVKLPTGILVKGKAFITDRYSSDLLTNSEYMTNQGSSIQVSKRTRITQWSNGCERTMHSCINEPPTGLPQWEKGNLVVHATDGNLVRVDTKDGVYKNVIVKQIDEIDPRVLVGEIDGVKAYVTKAGVYVFEDGQWLSDRISKLREHPNFVSAQEEVKELPDQNTKVDLRIAKQDGSKSRIVFSKEKPISQGKLAGLQTNVGHVFEEEGKRYPWVVYQGEPSVNTKGKATEGLAESVAKLATAKKGEELRLVFEAINTLEKYEVHAIMDGAETIDKEGLKQILDKYEPDRNEFITRNERLAEKMSVLTKHNIDTPAAIELQGELLSEMDSIRDSDIITRVLSLTSGREKLQEEVIKKTEEINDPGNALRHVESDNLRRMIIEKAKTVNADYSSQFFGKSGSAFPIQNYLMELEKLDPELQELAMNNLDLKSGIFIDSSHKGEALRRVLEFHKDKPEQMKALLDRMPMREDMGFNPVGFSTIYFNEEFQQKTKDMDFANKYSIAYTAQRYLDQRGTWLPDDRSKAIDLIIQQRARFSNHVVLDENTYYIPVTHEEHWFKNGEMVQLARDSGVKQMADQNMKGAEAKGKFLDSVKGSKDKGKTTVHFNGHGGPNHQWLSKGQAGVETSDQMRRPEAISYVEFGDALAERGNLGEVTVMIDSCYSKDFTDNLYHYLHSVKGVRDMPTVITETNRGQVGWINTFGPALERVHQKGQPLTGADILRVESETFFQQDLTVTMPVTSEEEAKFSKPETPGVVDLGSTVDEGAAEPPRKPKGESSEERPAELPPTVIEIAQNEQDMEELLAVS